MRRFFLTWAFLLLGLGFTAHAQSNSIDPFVMPSTRFSALGGNHTAAGDSFHTIFTNPASFVDIEKEFSASEITLTTYGPVLEIIDLLGSIDDLDSLDLSGIVNSSKGSGGLAFGLDLAGPISIGWVGNGLGLGFFNRTRVDAAVSGTKIKPAVTADFFLVGGYSLRILNQGNHVLDGGFLGKGFFRGRWMLETPIFDALSILDDPMGKPFDTFFGIGLDLGFRYTLSNNLTFSLVCFDLFSPVLVTKYHSFFDFGSGADPVGESSYAQVKRRLDFGVKYTISNSFIDRYFTGLVVMADYRDFLDLFSLVPRHPLLNIGIGAEITVLNVLSFRLGMTDALPSFGIGLDLSFLKLDMAIFGRELGLDPGKHPTYCLGLGILFRY